VTNFPNGAKYPKSRIEHIRAVDDILGRYYHMHGTYVGALVYIKPDVRSCSDPPLLALRTCEDRYEYCNYRPCVEAYDHEEMTNYAMPHRCTLRHNGLDCEALEDHRASAGGVVREARMTQRVFRKSSSALGTHTALIRERAVVSPPMSPTTTALSATV